MEFVAVVGIVALVAIVAIARRSKFTATVSKEMLGIQIDGDSEDG